MSLQSSTSKSHPLAYFFHLRGKSLVQKSLRGMLMELLYQVLEKYPRSFELIRPIFLNIKRLKQDWNIGSLTQAMLQIPHIPPAVPGHRDHITIFVDALDENQNQDDNNMLLSIFDNLNATYMDVRSKPGVPVLKICLASRPWPVFQQRLGDNPRVPAFAMHDFTMSDIQAYTNNRLLKTISRHESHGERQKTISRLSADIASRANGVFIWVKIVVDNLRQDITDGTPIASLLAILHEYPEELDDMYKFTLKRVRGAYRPETMIIFKIMLASRVPLTALQLQLITHICIGSPQYNPRPIDSSDFITSWLASRSGGLIDIVGTGAEERLSAVSGGSFKPIAQPASDTSFGSEFYVEFIHQTVQEFVRNSLDDSLGITTPQSSMTQLSGSCLLALACLDIHPPHPQLRNIANDIFSYIREFEREEEEKKIQKIVCLPHRSSYDLHDFPFEIGRSGIRGHAESTTGEMFSAYLDMNNELIPKLMSQKKTSDEFFDGSIPGYMTPFVLSILHNLYHTKAPEHFLKLAPAMRWTGRNLLLFMASVGPRLSEDRLDRTRMFRHVLAMCPVEGPHRIPYDFPYRPVNKLFGCVQTNGFRGSLATIIVALEPSPWLDDDTLLSFVQSLNGEGFDGVLNVTFPSKLTPRGQGSDKRVQTTPNIHKGILMTLSAFCSRFRETNRSKWVELFWEDWVDISSGSVSNSGNGVRPFYDLAAWDATDRRPPRHIYTSTTADVVTNPHDVMPQAIASIGIVPAVVGMGGSQIFRAFYPRVKS